MSPRFLSKPARHLAFRDLSDKYQDFMLSRHAKRCTQSTIYHYEKNLMDFLLHAQQDGCQSCAALTVFHVRKYLAELAAQGKADRTCHAAARVIKTFVRFLNKDYHFPLIEFDMPKLSHKRLLVLNAEQVRQIIFACNTRDKAMVMLMADSGLRNSEVCFLNWGDLNMENGLLSVHQGKGQKDRSAVVGATTRRALLKYRRTIPNDTDEAPMFQANYNHGHKRLTRTGLLLIYKRLSKLTGIQVTPHAMRRTFVILSLRRHMDAGHIQAMLGHATLDMVYHYAQLEDEDLIQAHKQSGPVDDLF